jgi:hypothetical protein
LKVLGQALRCLPDRMDIIFDAPLAATLSPKRLSAARSVRLDADQVTSCSHNRHRPHAAFAKPADFCATWPRELSANCHIRVDARWYSASP